MCFKSLHRFTSLLEIISVTKFLQGVYYAYKHVLVSDLWTCWQQSTVEEIGLYGNWWTQCEKPHSYCRHLFSIWFTFFCLPTFPLPRLHLQRRLVWIQTWLLSREAFVFHIQTQALAKHFDSICLVAQGNPPNNVSLKIIYFLNFPCLCYTYMYIGEK